METSQDELSGLESQTVKCFSSCPTTERFPNGIEVVLKKFGQIWTCKKTYSKSFELI